MNKTIKYKKAALIKDYVSAVTHFELAQGMLPIDELPPPIDL